MENLTSALLDLDTDHITSKPTSSANAEREILSDQLPPEQVGEQIEDPEPIVEEDIEEEEPWIETPLCTNCNECTNINPRMFNYNADKLAFIADPEAGTFAQLVEAAEKCPVKIIHPGKPLNPNEPGLEDLIKRAWQRFSQHSSFW